MITLKQLLMEGTAGQAKWDKYFGGDTDTIAKNDATLYDLFGKPKKEIAKGDPLTVLAGEYTPMPQVRVGRGTYTMKFTDIDKPFKAERSVGIALKPDQIGIVGKFTIAGYVQKVKKILTAHTEIPAAETEYLKALVDSANDPENEKLLQKCRDLYISSGAASDNSFKNTINTDFMEILGPLFVVAENPALAAGGVKFPELGNEPLYDFTMKFEGSVEAFSSKKSGGKTNTLKVNEVITAATKDPILTRTYKKELAVLLLIQNNSVKVAPGQINDWLAKNFKTYTPLPPADDPAGISAMETYVVKFINTQSKLNFLPLVTSAIPDLWYVKSRLNNDGTIKVEPLKSGRDIEVAKLRGKSSPGHLSDKIGFAM
jgi:hypothetical protein